MSTLRLEDLRECAPELYDFFNATTKEEKKSLAADLQPGYLIPNGRNEKNYHPLVIAILLGKISHFYLLAKQYPNALHLNDNFALRCAAQKGHLAVVQCLLEHKAVEEHITDEDNYALRYAAANGHLAVVQCLLEHKAVEEHITDEDNYALRYAAANGHLAVVQYLLKYKAVKEHITDEDNYALRYAAANGHLAVVQCLLEHKAVEEHIPIFPKN
jgi:ankyrin repeat protein